MKWTDDTKVEVMESNSAQLLSKEHPNNNSYSYGMTKDAGTLKLRITNCVTDSKGHTCDVILKIENIVTSCDDPPVAPHVNPPKSDPEEEKKNGYRGAVDRLGKDYLNGSKKKETRIRTVVSVYKEAGLVKMLFSTLFAKADFTINYVEHGGTTKAHIEHAFCVMNDIDVDSNPTGWRKMQIIYLTMEMKVF